MSDMWNETALQYRIGTSFLAEFAAGVVADGDLARLISAAHLAVTDFRDLRMNADALRHGS